LWIGGNEPGGVSCRVISTTTPPSGHSGRQETPPLVKREAEGSAGPEAMVGLTWDELARLGAPRLLQAALAAAVSAYVAAHQEARDAQGRAMGGRTGQARGRQGTSGSGMLTVQAPRVDARRVDDAGERRRCRRRLLPPSRRRSPQVAEGRPMPDRRGLSTGDVREARPVLRGEEAAGLSPTAITRLTAPWETAYMAFQPRDRSARADVDRWVEGGPCTIRRADARLGTLVVMGARADGTQAVMAVEDGDHESPERGRTVWRARQRRGMTAPVVAVGDGALGGGKAVEEVWPGTRAPRGWVPRLAHGRDTWPKRRPPNATRTVHERINAATRGDAEAAITAVTAAYQAQ
jgi:putative transposase